MKKIRAYTRKKKRTIRKVLGAYTDKKTGKRKETDIERRVRVFLEDNCIPFTQEKFIKYDDKWKAFDFYITDGLNYAFLVECDGKIWHNQTAKKGTGLARIQSKNVKNDKLKNKIALDIGVPLLRFSEDEIKNAFNKVRESILQEIKRQTPSNDQSQI